MAESKSEASRVRRPKGKAIRGASARRNSARADRRRQGRESLAVTRRLQNSAGDTSSTFVDGNPHSGAFAASLGPTGHLGLLSRDSDGWIYFLYAVFLDLQQLTAR